MGGDGSGASLSTDDGIKATYRGAVVQRSGTDDPANPVQTTVYLGYDISLPEGENQFLSDGFINSTTRIPLLDFRNARMEPCPVAPTLPRYQGGQGHRSNEALVKGPADLSFVSCFAILGSAISDEELAFDVRLDAEQSGTWATVGSPLDSDLLDDVEASIGWLHENLDPADRYRDGRTEWEPDVFGQLQFDKRYGSGLESFDRVGQAPSGEGGNDLADLDDEYSPDETLTPPTLPPTTAARSGSGADGATTTTAAPPADQGTEIDYPTVEGDVDGRGDDINLVASILKGMEKGGNGFKDCKDASPAEPCIDIRGHMHSNGRNHRIVVSVRLEPGRQTTSRDVWLVVENPDPTTSVWNVTQDWWVENDDRPSWAL